MNRTYDPWLYDALQDEWFELLERKGVPFQTSFECFEQFHDLYIAPGRIYHNCKHIYECIEHAKSAGLKHDATLMLAIYYHDAIYNPESSKNEEDSAELFRNHATKMGLAQDCVDNACRLILITKHHDRATQADEKIMADIDRAILASEPTKYDTYCAAIREEYSFATTEQYRDGRAAFIQSQLVLDQIYFTDWAQEAGFEVTARANLRREYKSLTD